MDKKGGCSIAGSPFIGTDTVSVLVLDDGDKKTEDLTARTEILAGYTAIEELDQDVASGAAATPGDQTTEGGSALYLLDGSYLDDAGYLHVPDGSLTLRVKNYKGSLQRIF